NGLGLPYWAAYTLALPAGLAAGWDLGPLHNRLLGVAFYSFNKAFEFGTELYTRGVGALLRVSMLVLAVYAVLLVLTWWSFTSTPTGFIPPQDKGYLL